MGTIHSRKEFSNDQNDSSDDYDETNSFSEQYDTLRLNHHHHHRGANNELDLDMATSRFGYRPILSKSTSSNSDNTTAPPRSGIRAQAKSTSDPRKEKKTIPQNDANVKRPLIDRLRQSFHRRPASTSTISTRSSQVKRTQPSLRSIPQSKTVDTLPIVKKRLPISKSKTVDASLAIYEDHEDVFIPIGAEGYFELENHRETAPLAKADLSASYTIVSPSDYNSLAENEKVEKKLKRSSTLSAEDEQLVTLNTYQHRHLVQDTIEIKTSILKLKRLLQNEEDTIQLGDFELQIKQLQEENKNLKKNILSLESKTISHDTKSTQTDVIKQNVPNSKIKKPNISMIAKLNSYQHRT